MLRSTIRMGRQLQNCRPPRASAPSGQIVAVSPKMKHVVRNRREAGVLSAPLLVAG
ncbi:hypothetical protein [Escherichia coli]|uniref:hypothetical protein n=1 Tax=Escherichia coli TaxID=562 RepID=UPI00223715E9|nr:hypothetical protein [Escherichia coli]MCW7363683.1 hypothetical protein [Escherichia coli]